MRLSTSDKRNSERGRDAEGSFHIPWPVIEQVMGGCEGAQGSVQVRN